MTGWASSIELLRVLLDTNVLVSGIVGNSIPASPPGDLITLWRRGRFVLLTSPDIIAEVQRTLEKPYFASRMPEDQRRAVMHLLSAYASSANPTTVVSGIASHPEDDRVLSAAISGHADLVVTGDRMLLALGSVERIPIIAPAAAVKAIT